MQNQIRLVVDNTRPDMPPVHEMTLPPGDVFDLIAVIRELSAVDFVFGDDGAVHLKPQTACDFTQWLATHGVHPTTPQIIYLPHNPAA